MNIEKHTADRVTTIVLEGWLDTRAAPELEEVLEELPPDTESIIFECKKLEYISSSGIRQIIVAYKRVKGNLTLKNLSEEILRVLEVTGIADWINME